MTTANPRTMPTETGSAGDRPRPVSGSHAVTGAPLAGPFPDHLELAFFAMGCFWGAEPCFWDLEGVHVTVAGYAGGHAPDPTYAEVCSGETGHAETVMVVLDPAVLGYGELLRRFWEGHDPTQVLGQGEDRGTQYRSAVFTATPAQAEAARASRDAYQQALAAVGPGAITTEIREASGFYPAEAHHQQYLARHPDSSCSVRGTGVACPADLASNR